MSRLMTMRVAIVLAVATVGHFAIADSPDASLEPRTKRYIVSLNGSIPRARATFGTAAVLPSLRDVAHDIAIRYQGQLVHLYENLGGGFAMQLSPHKAEMLELDARVDAVLEDEPEGIELFGGMSKPTESWSHDLVSQVSTSRNHRYEYTDQGEGAVVFVIDTGIDKEHQEFRNTRVLRGHSVFGGYGDTDENGHGTSVAGIIAGDSVGLAPRARLVPVRVIWKSRERDENRKPRRFVSNVIAGLDWALGKARNARRKGLHSVFNMSLGYTGGNSSLEELLDEKVREVIRAGFPVVVAAGNRADDASEFSPSGVDEAIVVGATRQGDARWDSSNWGPTIDLFAPGADVRVPVRRTRGYDKKSGTSFAAAHVTGAVALYIGKNRGPHEASPQEVEDRLISHAHGNRVGNPVGSANRLLYSFGL